MADCIFHRYIFVFVYLQNIELICCVFSLTQKISAMEKGQCPTVATWDGGNVRSRKATPTTATTPGQVRKNKNDQNQFVFLFFMPLYFNHVVFTSIPDFMFFLLQFVFFSVGNVQFPTEILNSNREFDNVFMTNTTRKKKQN